MRLLIALKEQQAEAEELAKQGGSDDEAEDDDADFGEEDDDDEVSPAERKQLECQMIRVAFGVRFLEGPALRHQRNNRAPARRFTYPSPVCLTAGG